VERITFNVPGMTCAHCERAVHDEITDVRGVDSVTIDLATKDVVVTGTALVLADLLAAIDEAGYEAVPA
jgi:copper chaperone CopZ